MTPIGERIGYSEIFHRGQLVVTHAVLPGQHQFRILPEHGPGAIARTARQRPSTPAVAGPRPGYPEVEVRDLAIYEALTTGDSGNTQIARSGYDASTAGARSRPCCASDADRRHDASRIRVRIAFEWRPHTWASPKSGLSEGHAPSYAGHLGWASMTTPRLVLIVILTLGVIATALGVVAATITSGFKATSSAANS